MGGGDRLSEAERQLVQRAAVLGAVVEHAEARFLAGKAVDLAEYLAAINAQRRLLVTLGLQRRPRDVTPSLQEYLARARAEEGTE